jgi:hypothetical protein
LDRLLARLDLKFSTGLAQRLGAQERADAGRDAPHLDRLARQVRCGVAAIGVAQELQRVFTGTTYHADADGGGVPRFG